MPSLCSPTVKVRFFHSGCLPEVALPTACSLLAQAPRVSARAAVLRAVARRMRVLDMVGWFLVFEVGRGARGPSVVGGELVEVLVGVSGVRRGRGRQAIARAGPRGPGRTDGPPRKGRPDRRCRSVLHPSRGSGQP